MHTHVSQTPTEYFKMMYQTLNRDMLLCTQIYQATQQVCSSNLLPILYRLPKIAQTVHINITTTQYTAKCCLWYQELKSHVKCWDFSASHQLADGKVNITFLHMKGLHLILHHALQFLNETFSDRWLSNGCLILMPPRLPNFIPSIFCCQVSTVQTKNQNFPHAKKMFTMHTDTRGAHAQLL
jgi:hypothetical protein